MLLEVVLGKDFHMRLNEEQNLRRNVRLRRYSLLVLVPLLLRNSFKLVRNRRHLADRRRGGVASYNIDIDDDKQIIRHHDRALTEGLI